MKGSIGFIYGSDTGVTEEITNDMASKMDAGNIEVIEVCNAEIEDFRRFDLLMLGLSTWYDGDLQSDWEDYFDTFKTIDFTDKIVALYGLGDQLGYDDYFVDGIGMLAEVILENGGTIIGNWPSEDYDFSESKGLKDDSTFFGLALDEDNEPQKTPERVEQWLSQVQQEYQTVLQGT
ncbi:MAG: flavodoxin [Bacteroidota bacterium]